MEVLEKCVNYTGKRKSWHLTKELSSKDLSKVKKVFKIWLRRNAFKVGIYPAKIFKSKYLSQLDENI